MRKRHELQVAENKKRIESGEQPEEYIYEPPSPGERFKYVIVKQTQFYDIRGKKINLGKGDLMEFVHVVKKLGLEIDIGQYLKTRLLVFVLDLSIIIQSSNQLMVKEL